MKSSKITMAIGFGIALTASAFGQQVVQRYEQKLVTEVRQNVAYQTNWQQVVSQVPTTQTYWTTVSNLVTVPTVQYVFETNAFATPIKAKKAKGAVIAKSEYTVVTEVVKKPVYSNYQYWDVKQVPQVVRGYTLVTNVVPLVTPLYSTQTNSFATPWVQTK